MSNIVNGFAIITKFHVNDGGSIYFDKHLKAIDPGINFIELYNVSYLSRALIFILNIRPIRVIRRIPGCILIELLLYKFISLCIAHQLMQSASARNVDFVIIPTESLYPLEMALQLKRKKYVKRIHFCMLDLPWTYKNSKFNNHLIRKYIERKMRFIDSVDYVTDEMKKIFRQKREDINEVVTNVMVDVLSYEPQNKKMQIVDPLRSPFIKIGFAGSFRFKDEIIKFIDSMNSEMVEMEFHCFSKNSLEHHKVVNRGFWGSRDDLLTELRAMDAGFVPMSFDPTDRTLVETSFPSKAMTYLTAGLPLVVWAPEYAAISKFVKKHRIGIVLDSTGTQALSSVLSDFYCQENFELRILELKCHAEETYKKLKDIAYGSFPINSD